MLTRKRVLVPASALAADSFSSSPLHYVELSVLSFEKITAAAENGGGGGGDHIKCTAKDLSSNPRTIHITFANQHAGVKLGVRALVRIQGVGVKVVPTSTTHRGDPRHAFSLVVDNDDCVVEVTPPKQLRSMPPPPPVEAAAASAPPAPPPPPFDLLKDLQVGCKANVYAVVTNTVFPVRTNAHQVRWSLRVMDDSLCSDPGVEVVVFQPADKCSGGGFPAALEQGSVVRILDAKAGSYSGSSTLSLFKHSSLECMPASSSSSSSAGGVTVVQASCSPLPDIDWARVDELRRFFHDAIAPTCHVFNQYTLTLSQLDASDVMPAGFADVVVRVKTVPSLCLYSFDVEDYAVGGGGGAPAAVCAVVKLRGFANKDAYWPMVCQAVGGEEGALIKIRNCQIEKQQGQLTLFAVEALTHESVATGTHKTTGFFRLHKSVPLPTLAPSSTVAGVAPSFAPPAAAAAAYNPQQPPPQLLLPTWMQRPLLAQVHQNDAKLPLSALRTINANNDAQGGGAGGPYRVRVRVVDHFPASVASFTRPSTTTESGGGGYDWAFALLVEDLTDRAEVYVTGEHGQAFFQLAACNLEENNASLAQVERSVKRLKHTPLACIECVLRRLSGNTPAFAVEHTSIILT